MTWSMDTNRRRPGEPGRPAFAAGLIVVILWGSSLLAQDRPAIGLQCDLSSSYLQSLYGPQVSDKVAGALCRQLQENLKRHTRLGFWRYEIAPPQRPGMTMHFEVLDGAATETLGRMRLRLAHDGPSEPFCGDSVAAVGSQSGAAIERRCWQVVIHEPGAVGDPRATRAPITFAMALRERLLDRFVDEIERHLRQKMALAWARWLDPDREPPTVVAALPWDEFGRLQDSEFHVACRLGDNRLVLQATGHWEPAPFTPDAPRIRRALVVELTERRGPSDPLQLAPAALYLRRYTPPRIEAIDLPDTIGEPQGDLPAEHRDEQP